MFTVSYAKPSVNLKQKKHVLIFVFIKLIVYNAEKYTYFMEKQKKCCFLCGFGVIIGMCENLPYYMVGISRKDIDMVYDLQKASMWKRASAYIFDFILFGILVVGIALLLSFCLGYDAQIESLEATYSAYEEKYGIDLNISLEEFEKLSEEQKALYGEANEAFAKDPEVNRTYSLILNLTLIIITFSILGAYLITELLVPLILKNGQTFGKKIFGVAVMRVDGVRISPLQLFIRTVLGKFTIETMFPVFIAIMTVVIPLGIVGTVVLIMFGVLQICVLMISKTNSAIHDLIAGTVAVDMASQMIFNSPEELMEYKKRIHAEKAKRETY